MKSVQSLVVVSLVASTTTTTETELLGSNKCSGNDCNSKGSPYPVAGLVDQQAVPKSNEYYGNYEFIPGHVHQGHVPTKAPASWAPTPKRKDLVAITEPVFSCPKPGYTLINQDCYFNAEVPMKQGCAETWVDLSHELPGSIINVSFKGQEVANVDVDSIAGAVLQSSLGAQGTLDASTEHCLKFYRPKKSCGTGGMNEKGECVISGKELPSLMCAPGMQLINGDTCYNSFTVDRTPVCNYPESYLRGDKCVVIEREPVNYICPPGYRADESVGYTKYGPEKCLKEELVYKGKNFGRVGSLKSAMLGLDKKKPTDIEDHDFVTVTAVKTEKSKSQGSCDKCKNKSSSCQCRRRLNATETYEPTSVYTHDSTTRVVGKIPSEMTGMSLIAEKVGTEFAQPIPVSHNVFTTPIENVHVDEEAVIVGYILDMTTGVVYDSEWNQVEDLNNVEEAENDFAYYYIEDETVNSVIAPSLTGMSSDSTTDSLAGLAVSYGYPEVDYFYGDVPEHSVATVVNRSDVDHTGRVRSMDYEDSERDMELLCAGKGCNKTPCPCGSGQVVNSCGCGNTEKVGNGYTCSSESCMKIRKDKIYNKGTETSVSVKPVTKWERVKVQVPVLSPVKADMGFGKDSRDKAAKDSWDLGLGLDKSGKTADAKVLYTAPKPVVKITAQAAERVCRKGRRVGDQCVIERFVRPEMVCDGVMVQNECRREVFTRPFRDCVNGKKVCPASKKYTKVDESQCYCKNTSSMGTFEYVCHENDYLLDTTDPITNEHVKLCIRAREEAPLCPRGFLPDYSHNVCSRYDVEPAVGVYTAQFQLNEEHDHVHPHPHFFAETTTRSPFVINGASNSPTGNMYGDFMAKKFGYF